MAQILTDEELKEILNNPVHPTIWGFGGYPYAHKMDIYSEYLTRQFEKIDKNFPLSTDEDNNKGLKGELLACGIIDLTMWLCGFSLGKDYTVFHGFKDKSRGNSVDFKLTCQKKVYLIEAKNWNIGTYVDERTYEQKIRNRFFGDGKNILLIREDRVPDVEKMYKGYPPHKGLSTLNGNPINYIKVSHFIDKSNDIFDICWNLTFGVLWLLYHIELGYPVDSEREFSLKECILMGMPTWFIVKYCQKSERTISRKAGKLGYNRKSSEFKQMTKYREILENYIKKHKCK